MRLVRVKRMVGKNHIRIIGSHAQIDRIDHIGMEWDVFCGKIQDLNVPDPQYVKSIQAFFHSSFVRALNPAFFIGIAGFAHNEGLHLMPCFNSFRKRPSACDLDIIQMCANGHNLHVAFCSYMFTLPCRLTDSPPNDSLQEVPRNCAQSSKE